MQVLAETWDLTILIEFTPLFRIKFRPVGSETKHFQCHVHQQAVHMLPGAPTLFTSLTPTIKPQAYPLSFSN